MQSKRLAKLIPKGMRVMPDEERLEMLGESSVSHTPEDHTLEIRNASSATIDITVNLTLSLEVLRQV